VLCDRGFTDVVDLTLSEMLARVFSDGGLGHVDGSDRLARCARALSQARCVRVGTDDLDLAARNIEQLLARPTAPVAVAPEPLDDGALVYIDGEALIHAGGSVHHLDPLATAVWILHTDGEGESAIASELGLDPALVERTIRRFADLELPAPAR
jgi:hypothetical protein